MRIKMNIENKIHETLFVKSVCFPVELAAIHLTIDVFAAAQKASITQNLSAEKRHRIRDKN